ncbi:ATP-binding protein [soil metagenome]
MGKLSNFDHYKQGGYKRDRNKYSCILLEDPGDLLRPTPFYNREKELASLARGWNYLPKGAMAMVYGRRRLGKTYLLQRLFTEPAEVETRVVYYLASQSTDEVHRREMADRVLAALPDPFASIEELAVSWMALLRYASRRAREIKGEARVAIVLDEFPYLVEKTPELPSILQGWWDAEGLHSPIYAVLCGSQLSAMAALGEETKPLYGRFNAGRHLVQPMRYDDVGRFYEGQAHYGPAEKLKMYGALGGAPRYHAMVRPDRPWDEELVDLLFRPGGQLEDEARFLLSSEQIRDVATYQAVLGAVASGRTRRGAIANATGIGENGLSHPLNVLQELGWVAREKPYGEKGEGRALYRVADPFLSFHHRFVTRTASAVQFADPMAVFKRDVEPHFADYMGRHVFESVCAQWLWKRAATELGLMPTDLGRWWSRDGQTEIDLVAPLDGSGTLFGECKWSANAPVDTDVLVGLQRKVVKLPEPKWLKDPRYVLFSLGGFSERLRSIARNDPHVMLVDGSMLF